MNFQWLYLLLIAFSGVGVIYAVVALKFFVHWTRNAHTGGAKLILWQFLVLTPIGWVLYLKLKPWQKITHKSPAGGTLDQNHLRSE